MTVTSTKPRLERTTLTTSRLLDFCSRKELIAQTGHEPSSWPLVVLKELLDNALDACEESDVPPVIDVAVDSTGITVRDNGPGLPAKTIEAALDFSVRVSSREAYVAPDRGAQGNALKTIFVMPYVLDGERGEVEIASHGELHRIAISVDHIRQEPVPEHRVEPSNCKKGTEITVHWPQLACSILEAAKSRFLQIGDDYTWLNPHLTLSVDWFGDVTKVAATDLVWKKWRPSNPTSPHWYAREHFERLIAGYIAHDQDHGTDRTVRDFVSEFRGLSGPAKQKAVLAECGLARTNLTSLLGGNGLEAGRVESLLAAMKAHSKPVKPPHLGVIGKDHMRERFESVGCEMDSFNYHKDVGFTDDVPWVMEMAFGWIPNDTACRRLVTGVNWSPGILNPFRQLGKFGKSCDAILTSQRISEDEPVILVLHVTCPRVEYTDRGKSAVVMGS